MWGVELFSKPTTTAKTFLMQPKSPIVVELRNDGGGYYGSGGSEEETTTLTSSSSSSHSSIIGIEGASTTNANDVEQHQNNGSCDEDPVVLDDMDTILMDDDAISYDAELTTPMLIRSNNKAIHRSASAHSGSSSSCCRRNHHEDGNNNNSSHIQSYTTTTAATATATNHNHKKQRVSSCWWWQWLFATGSQGGGAGKDHPKTIITNKSWFSSSVVATAVFVLCCGLCLFFAVLGLPFPNRQLPSLPPLPHDPKRAFATLHSDSNPCYDMLLYVCLSTWQATHSQYPMLVLHSVPLPEKVQALIDAQQTQQQQEQAGRIIPVSIPAVNNYFVLKDRVRSASAKFAVWDQTAYDQMAYFDSDTIFFDSGDSIFTSPSDGTGNLWLYARPYPKYWQRGIRIFNSGNFLVRPHAAVYQKIMELFQRRFWILSFRQFFKTADQGFLNAVFSPHGTAWDLLAPPDAELDQVKHVKLWVAMAGLAKYNVTAQVQQGALHLAQDLDLQNDLDECHRHRRFSD